MSNSMITKRELARSFHALILELPFEKISVSDIVESCGLTRNSFYYHFKDKYELLNWFFTTELTRDIHEATGSCSGWDIIGRIIGYMHRNRTFYQHLEYLGQDSYFHHLRDVLEEILLEYIDEMFEPGADREFYIAYLADGIVGVIARWLKSEDHLPPDELTSMIQKAANGTLVKAKTEAVL